MAQMALPGLKYAIIASIVTVCAGAANAQQFISETRDYTVTWSNSAFANADAFYQSSRAYGAVAFSNATFNIDLLSNAQNFAYFQGGGVTVSSPAPTPPYPASVTATYSGDGTAGYWGWQNNTAAGVSGSGLPLTLGRLGADATLNFDVGGFDGYTYAPPVGYYVFVYLPGNWTTPGTSPGDYIFTGVNPLFSTPTFAYDSGTNTTTVETFTTDFTGGTAEAPMLQFTLVGSAVPEASTWAMMALGFGALGFAGYGASRKRLRFMA
jgi:PEP-CTERM motif